MNLSRPLLSRPLFIALKVLSIVAFLATAVGIAIFLWSNRKALSSALEAPAYLWFIPIGIYFVMLVTKGLSFDLLVNTFAVRVPFLDSLGITASGLLGNYALPGNASLPLRTLYLQRVHGLSYRDFLPIAFTAYICSTGIYGVLTALCAILSGPVDSKIYNGLIAVLGIGGFFLIFATLVSIKAVKLFRLDTERFLKGWRQFLHAPILPWLWLGTDLLRAALEVGLVYAVLRILKVDMPLGWVAVMTLAKECSVILRLTPGSFGVTEGVQVFFAAMYRIDVPSVLLSALIIRAVELAWLALVSLLLMSRLIGKIGAGAHAASPSGNKQSMHIN